VLLTQAIALMSISISISSLQSACVLCWCVRRVGQANRRTAYLMPMASVAYAIVNLVQLRVLAAAEVTSADSGSGSGVDEVHGSDVLPCTVSNTLIDPPGRDRAAMIR
jgi:hypothetical protein